MSPVSAALCTSSAGRTNFVLLPGTLCDRRVFWRIRQALRARASVVHAGLHGLPRPAGVAAWAQRLLDRLPPRFVLAGFSLGGLLALELLRRAPHRVQGLAMIASNADAGSRAGAHRSRRLWRDWRGAGAAAVARGLKPRYFFGDDARRRNAGLVRAMALATPPRAARAQFEWAASRPNGLALLQASRMPLLLVTGRQDTLCPRPMQQRMLRARPDARWTELPRCGHFVPLEAPAALSRSLLQWLPATNQYAESGACN